LQAEFGSSRELSSTTCPSSKLPAPNVLPTDQEELPYGVLCQWGSGYGGGAWRPGGLERVDPLALFLRHIGPPVIVTAEHVKLHFVGLPLSGVTPGRRERLQSLYHERSCLVATNRRRPERFVALR
jgi:hypothetical protein